MALLTPDRYFARITRIDIKRDILGQGFTSVLLDVDNTILSRETNAVPRDVGMWLGRAREAGVRFCLVSNNWHANVVDLAAEFGLPIVSKAMKPFPAAFFRARGKIGATRRETVVVGDQLMTDVMGAHLAGLRAYLLAPLVEKDLPHTLLLRTFERAIMGDREPEGAPAPTASSSGAANASSSSDAENKNARIGDARTTGKA